MRLFRPTDGDKVFARVQEAIGGRASATMRGEEMMRGVEWEVLERAVWGDGEGGGVFEAEVESGDGLFVPRGWWHSVKGVGEGMTGSVSWSCMACRDSVTDWGVYRSTGGFVERNGASH